MANYYILYVKIIDNSNIYKWINLILYDKSYKIKVFGRKVWLI